MANFTTSKRVNLYDQRSDTVLLHPATELSAVDVVSGGIVQISGNSIWVDPEDPLLSGAYAFKNEVGSLAYTSLTEEAVNGGTHTIYGGTVTGTGIITSRIDVTTNVRTPYTSASNDLIPTERAVAFKLDTKQDYLISGSGITIAPDENNRPVISVKMTQTIAPLASASADKLPSESATRYAIDSAVNSLEIAMSSYATSAWCLDTFWQKGETPSSSGGSSDVPYATYTVAGKVMPIENQGLVIGGAGSLTVHSAGVYATFGSAAAQPHGAVRVLNTIASDGSYANTAYVPHVNAVYSHVSNTLLNYQSTLAFQSGVSKVTGTNSVCLEKATTAALGGVMVPTGNGLTISNTGAIAMIAATTAGIGGVQLKSAISAPGNTNNVLPTEAAVVSYVASETAFPFKVTATGGLTAKIAAGHLYYETTGYELSITETTITAPASTTTTYYLCISRSNAQSTNSNWASSYVSAAEAPTLLKQTFAIARITTDSTKITAIEQFQVGDIYATAIEIAPSPTTFASASAMVSKGEVGGVVCARAIFSKSNETSEYPSIQVVPTLKAVSSAYGPGPEFLITDTLRGGNGVGAVVIRGGHVYDSNGTSVTSLGGGICYLSGTTSSGIYGAHVYKTGGAWTAEELVDISNNTNSTDNYYVPIVSYWSSGTSVYAQQIRDGAIVIGRDTPSAGGGGGGGGTTTSAYNGPFAVKSEGDITSTVSGLDISGISVSISSGLVCELDQSHVVEDSSFDLYDGQTLYLYGSSGANATNQLHTIAPFEYMSTGTAMYAGEFAIPIAMNAGGAIVQLQYGNLQREHWGDDYREEFNISRIKTTGISELPSNPAGGDTAFIPYVFQVINGGKVLGPINTDATTIAYPLTTVSGNTRSDGLYIKLTYQAGETTAGWIVSGGVEYDHLVTRMPVWMNIWSGSWTAGGQAVGGYGSAASIWRYVVDTACYESAAPVGVSNAYSVQLGYITANGAPIQTHKGAIEIRGRWA